MPEGLGEEHASVAPWEWVALAALVVVAATVRFVDLPTRGTWDADQGHDMLVLWRMVHEGTWPLLGPPTSIGDFHHGALYYYLLAPAAFLSGADPLVVVGSIAVAGVVAVPVVWWLARSVAGSPIAGVVAASLMAVSASAIEESTFIWNPNLIALSSAVSIAAAWRAWTSGRASWWVVSAAGLAVTMHCHVLGAVMVVPLAAWLLLDVRRRAPVAERGAAIRAGVGAAILIAVTWLPLAINELQSDFSESRAAADFLTGGSDPAPVGLAARLVIVPLRVLSWPLTGLITSLPVAGILAALAVAAILAWRVLRAPAGERFAARWFALTLAWTAGTLAVAASGLGTVVPGLPNDHYHAFADPIVFVTLGLGAAALWRSGLVGRAAAAVAIAALVVINVSIWPPHVAPDGGYPAAEVAAGRILENVPGRSLVLDGLPTLKNTDAYGFPLTRLGAMVATEVGVPGQRLVIACDRLLEPIIGAACNGPAEEARLGELRLTPTLVERFDASGRTVISIYR